MLSVLSLPFNQMLPSQVLKVARYPKYKAGGPECGQDFCRLGCVCSSLQHLNRGPLHCRRPECMFGCACFKRKITKQISAGEGEQQVQPVYCKIKLFFYHLCMFFLLFWLLYLYMVVSKCMAVDWLRLWQGLNFQYNFKHLDISFVFCFQLLLPAQFRHNLQ